MVRLIKSYNACSKTIRRLLHYFIQQYCLRNDVLQRLKLFGSSLMMMPNKECITNNITFSFHSNFDHKKSITFLQSLLDVLISISSKLSNIAFVFNN